MASGSCSMSTHSSTQFRNLFVCVAAAASIQHVVSNQLSEHLIKYTLSDLMMYLGHLYSTNSHLATSPFAYILGFSY